MKPLPHLIIALLLVFSFAASASVVSSLPVIGKCTIDKGVVLRSVSLKVDKYGKSTQMYKGFFVSYEKQTAYIIRYSDRGYTIDVTGLAYDCPIHGREIVDPNGEWDLNLAGIKPGTEGCDCHLFEDSND
jgi:hypothetical protein